MSFDLAFADIRPAYEIPHDDLVNEVLIPAMSSSEEVRLAAGFFSSRCLAQLAPGLAEFVNKTSNSLDLLVSTEITAEDREAIQRGVKAADEVLNSALQQLFDGAFLSPSAVERHAVETLAYLVASGRLRMRVVLMQQGMYHKKFWLFRSGSKWLAVHGSGNATERGLLMNGEQMSIDRAWLDGERSESRVRLFLSQWEEQWTNRVPGSLTVDVDRALTFLSDRARSEAPTYQQFWQAWRQDFEAGLEPTAPAQVLAIRSQPRLQIPESLVWREGRFAHQGAAVDALLQHEGGILAIATGGGKTKTALIAATEMQEQRPGHLCIVVLAPTRPLIRQWASDIRAFGVEPTVLSGASASARRQELENLLFAFSAVEPRTEVLLMSNSLFTQTGSPERHWLETLPDSIVKLLIADEVHNLGARSFRDNLPLFFGLRIGLSATPIRQYDPDGTDKLFGFFGGPPRFEFTLKDAIQAGCLVPYNYHLHVVDFEPDEMERYEDLTEQLVRAGFKVDDNGITVGLSQRVQRLLRDRRALVEQAKAKLGALEVALKRIGPTQVKRTLVYTSAKPVAGGSINQITEVNRTLERLNVISHQYTGVETGRSGSKGILNRFASGDYQVLTAMKVLDEGVDIPETNTAFLLASSTVEREWIQRRGRILRQAPGKHIADLHDFIVVPPDLESAASKSLLRSELRRAKSFVEVSDNEYDRDGPGSRIRSLENQLWGIEPC